MAKPPLILASASPRRHQLLGEAGVHFEILVSQVGEELDGRPDPVPAARELAERKAQAVAQGLGAGDSGRWVLGADTVVALGEDGDATLLGKPQGETEAREMLTLLSGTRHRVVTGICVVRCSDGKAFLDAECTHVTMRALTPDEVDAYVASGEWRDKAGGYAIQETADAFVEKLEGGGFDNVVGLPVDRVLALLATSGLANPHSGS